MNIKERIHASLAGEMPDQIPWTIYRGLLPGGDTADRLHSLGLGFVITCGTYSGGTPNVQVEEHTVEEGGVQYRVSTYKTPVGEISQRLRSESGYGSSRIVEHFIKDVKDYEVLEFIIRDAVYRPAYDGFIQAEQHLGDSGFIMTSVERTPIQKLWIQYTGIERMSLDLFDNRVVVERILDAMMSKAREYWAIVADSPAEFVWCPDNITGVVVGPPLFDEFCVPYYNELASVMHKKGKRLVAHMDGMMRCLVDSVRKVDVDIIEAFTPPPDGDLSVVEALESWEDKVLWLNFPSSIHLAEPEQIREITIGLLKEAAPGRRFLIGVTENIPHGVWERSLTTITETINQYGKCPITSY